MLCPTGSCRLGSQFACIRLHYLTAVVLIVLVTAARVGSLSQLVCHIQSPLWIGYYMDLKPMPPPPGAHRVGGGAEHLGRVGGLGWTGRQRSRSCAAECRPSAAVLLRHVCFRQPPAALAMWRPPARWLAGCVITHALYTPFAALISNGMCEILSVGQCTSPNPLPVGK
jgi:hypothetical protein